MPKGELKLEVGGSNIVFEEYEAGSLLVSIYDETTADCAVIHLGVNEVGKLLAWLGEVK